MSSGNMDAILKKEKKQNKELFFCPPDALDVNVCNVERLLFHY